MKNRLQPIIIVGAARSGTKMLRDILASHPDLSCFPREINYIWRYRNAKFPTDELKPIHARPEVVRYIHKRFATFSSTNNGRRIIEKTCANSLRVEFVHAVFPKVYIIHLIRDGRTVAESARRCWQAHPKVGYLLEKARWLPLRDISYYGIRYLRYQLGRLSSVEAAQSSWGPRFSGLDRMIKEKSLIEVCGIQWKTCAQAAENAIKKLPPERTITVRYEDIVENPASSIEHIFKKLKLNFAPACREFVEREVHSGNLNKWRGNLSREDLEFLMPHISSELTKHGYKV